MQVPQLDLNSNWLSFNSQYPRASSIIVMQSLLHSWNSMVHWTIVANWNQKETLKNSNNLLIIFLKTLRIPVPTPRLQQRSKEIEKVWERSDNHKFQPPVLRLQKRNTKQNQNWKNGVISMTELYMLAEIKWNHPLETSPVTNSCLLPHSL